MSLLARQPIGAHVLQVVAESDHLITVDPIRRILPEVIHELFHDLHARFPFKAEALLSAEIVTIGRIQLIEHVDQILALPGIKCRHLADEHGSHHSILVPDIGTGQITVALLEAENVPIGFPRRFHAADLLANEFEAGEHIQKLHTVLFRHPCRQIGSHDGLHRQRPLRKRTHGLSLGSNVIEEQRAHFVSGQEFIVALILDGDAHPVAVRVGGQQQIRASLLAIFHPQLQCLLDLRVREGAGGEIPVRVLLLFDHGDVLDADAL